MAVVKSLTVLLPTYNGALYLPEQIESLRKQTDADSCVLIQDDGSTDETLAFLDSLKNDSLFAFGTEFGRHFGAKDNFLSMMRQVKSPYVALCDQDDVWEPDRLALGRRALEEAEARLGPSTPLLVHSDCKVTDAEGHIIHESFFAHQGWDPEAKSLSRLLVQNNVTGCTVMMNHALCRLVADHANSRIFMHDWFIAQTAAAFGEILFIPQPLVRYRQHGNNAIGASKSGFGARILKTVRSPELARQRIALTYDQAAVFRDCHGDDLPEEARTCVDEYLATQSLPKLKRIRAVRCGGYTMQSRIARMGQMLFG